VTALSPRQIADELATLGIVPVITIEDVAAAAPLAAALERGGLPVAEVTLRTPDALAALRAMKRAAPSLLVGAGTLRTPRDVEAAVAHGADFLVSPGTTPALERALLESGRLAIPGVATPSEALARAEAGFSLLKLFPAEAVGGRALLRSLAGPLPELRFVPTGGIDAARAPDYLALPNVVAIGGSWIAERSAIRSGDWAGIEARARAARALVTGGSD